MITFLSIIDSFYVFSCSNLNTLIQSLSFVYRNFNFDMYSLVIKIVILVTKAVEEVNPIPMLGIINDIVEVEKADPDAINISAIVNNPFFLFKILYFFYNIHYQF